MVSGGSPCARADRARCSADSALSQQELSRTRAAVRGRLFGRRRPAGSVAAPAPAPLAVPPAVADSVLALRLRLALLSGNVRLLSSAWQRRGIDTLRCGVTCHLEAARLRDLQRITFALFDWNPALFDANATAVLSWCDAQTAPAQRLPPSLVRLRPHYDRLCDLGAIQWIDLITRVSPEMPEVVVRDWLALLVIESVDDGSAAAAWFRYLESRGAVEAVALGVAVGDAEFLDAVTHCLVHCSQPPFGRAPDPAARKGTEDPPHSGNGTATGSGERGREPTPVTPA